jgi:hypothetical protein
MAENRFGRDAVKKPTCPFCGLIVEKPRELPTRMPNEMPLGTCSCGAVFACDETGHNIGIAQLDALLFSCNMDSDLAWGLVPGDDYIQEIVERYDRVKHLIVPGGVYEGRRVAGALFFVRLHKDVREVTDEGVKKRMKKASSPGLSESASPAISVKGLSKKEIEDCVSRFDAQPILGTALHDKKLLPHLQRLLYSGDDLLRKRAALIMGQVCSIVGKENPAVVSKLLQRLFTAVNDTAAFTWGAFEAIGEIISRKPELFSGYIPYLYQFLEDDTRRAQALETMGRIALDNPELLRKVTFRFISFLNDPDPQVRGLSSWLLGNLGAYEAADLLEGLLEDGSEIRMFREGFISNFTISQIVSEALEKIRTEKDQAGS